MAPVFSRRTPYNMAVKIEFSATTDYNYIGID